MKSTPIIFSLILPVLLPFSVMAQPPALFPSPGMPAPGMNYAPQAVKNVPQAVKNAPQAYPVNPNPYYPQFQQPMRPAYGYPPRGTYPAQYGFPAFPQGAPAQNPATTSQKPFKEYSGYLGLITDLLPSSVAAQLPDGISQGILFKGFSKNSPASHSDLKPFDVIFAYDETKLNHPAQLIKLIRNDKPGRIAKFKVVRKGKVLEIPVTIGSQKTPNPKDVNGLEIKQIGKSTYRAIIHFLGPNGNKQLRSFEGTREDIFDEVLEARGLPQAERQQLLYAMHQQKNNSGFGSFMPFGNNGSKDWQFMNPRKYFKW